MESSIEKSKIKGIYNLLRIIFGAVPIVAGLDKFTNLLVDWTAYLNPLMLKVIPLNASAFMHLSGIIEISAGIIVLARPRIGSFIVSAWLLCIALSLITSGHFLDIAVRDLVMSAGAFTLGRISLLIEEKEKSVSPSFASQHT